MMFLSHAGADGEAARALATLLRGAGFEVWLDLERLQPSHVWQHEISAALAKSQALMLYVGRLGGAGWVDLEVQLALDRRARHGAFPIIPVLGPGSDPKMLPGFIGLFQGLDMREAPPPPEKLRAILDEILKTAVEPVSALPPDRSPFAGLRAFDVADALLFFGRETETEELLERLRRDSVLLVVGDSGSGKSSLVRAGLIPALLRGRFHDGQSWVTAWRIAITRPGNDPFGELAENLQDLQPDSPMRAEQIGANRRLLAEGVDGLRNIIAAGVPAGSRTLLVIDQFEELFTSTPDPATRRHFIDCLLRAANASGSRPVHIVLTLRADFYARCWEHPELPSRGAKNQYAVRHIGPDILRQLIEGPLSLAGARAEPGLVETILGDVGEGPGKLPLLEHALDQLWRNRRVDAGTWITHEAYDRLGRLSGALRRHANEAMARLPGDEARALARQFFVELVQLGEGTEDTRRRVPVPDLLIAAGDREKTQLVLAQLASERLITTGNEYAEVAHEALIRAWPELREWVDAQRTLVRIERRLLEDAREWERLGRDPGALLAGSRLAEAKAWLAAARRPVAPLALEIVRESLKARRKRRLRMASIAAGAASVFVILLGWTVFHSRRLDLIDSASELLSSNPPRNPPCAVAMALKADQWFGDTDSRGVLEEAVQAATSPLGETGRGAVLAVAFSPDGGILGTGDADGAVSILSSSVDQSKLPVGLLRPPLDMDGVVEAIAFSPDGALLAAGSSKGMVRVLKVADGTMRFPIPALVDNVTAISFGPDSDTLAVGYLSGKVSLWKLDATAPFRSLQLHETGVSALTFSPDEHRLAVGARNGTIAIWPPDSDQPAMFETRETLIDNLAFNPDGSRLLSAARSGGVHWWQQEGRQEIKTKQSVTNATAAALSADGKVLATSHPNQTVVIRDAASFTAGLSIGLRADIITKLALNRQGNRLAAANQAGGVRVYELDPGRLHTAAVQAIGQGKPNQLDQCRDSLPFRIPKTYF
jgi:WD40 repeat protein